MRKCGNIVGTLYIDKTWNLGYFGGRTMRENKLGGISFVDGDGGIE